MTEKTIDVYEEILLAAIDRPEKSIRMGIDPAYIKELSDSIREQGLLQPIVVHRKGERFGIIAGDCRYLAVTLLGWTKVPCVIKVVTEEQVHLQRAIENLQRFDMTPIEEAHTYYDLKENFKMSLEAIAQKTGKTVTLVKRRIDLLKMPQCLIDAVHSRKIGYSIAEILDRIKDKTALNYYLTFALENGITAEVARQWVKDWEDAQRRSQSDVVTIDSLPPAMSMKPTFYACDTCASAVEIQNVKTLRCCPDCFTIIRTNLSPS